MFIAFEGPDKTGKSTSADNLAFDGKGIYNVTKEVHEEMRRDMADYPELPVAYDRIDWLTHMAYRLALPEHEWNDPRVRTVFAMPDTHLVFKLHEKSLAGHISDELYTDGTLATVNDMYSLLSRMIMDLNEAREWALFKTVTIIEVSNDLSAGTFTSRLLHFSSPVFKFIDVAKQRVRDDETLLELLNYEDYQRL